MNMPRIIACALALLAPGLAAAQPAASTSATDAHTNRVRIEYVLPTNPAHQPVYDLMKKHSALERMQLLLSPFRLPRDLTLRVTGCGGVVNAWYEYGVVTVCYEYLDFVLKNMPKEETRLGITPEDALLGQLYYVFLHETGHAMFDLLNASVFGGEEQGADEFATYIMLQMGKDEAYQMIMGATFTFKNFIDKPEITTPTANFSDIHGTPAQRFFNLLCIGYGARPDVFGEVVDKGLLPQGRAQDCAFEYGALAWAFRTQIAPHIDEQQAQKVLDRSWIPEVTARPKRPSHATNIEK